jgi:hypothetical protein
VTRKTKDTKHVPNAALEVAVRQPEVRSPRPRQEAELAIPGGERDLTALRSVTREWLVPRLVEEFLRERGVALRAHPQPIREKPMPMNEKKNYGSPR